MRWCLIRFRIENFVLRMILRFVLFVGRIAFGWKLMEDGSIVNREGEIIS